MVLMVLYLKITLKNQITLYDFLLTWFWFTTTPLCSSSPVLLNSFWSQSPLCCQTHILIPPSCPSLPPFSSPWFSIQLLWIWVFSFHAPRKEVKEKHSALNFKAWVRTPVHTSSEQNSQLYIRKATWWTSTGFGLQVEAITAFQVSFSKQAILSIQPYPVYQKLCKTLVCKM